MVANYHIWVDIILQFINKVIVSQTGLTMHNFNSVSFLTVAVAQAADNVMEAFRSMRQGMRSTTRKHAREEFNTKKDKREKPVWQH